MTHQQIHAKALAVAGRHQCSVSEIIDVLQELDAGKTYHTYECSSLYRYAVQYLKLSEDTAITYIAIARKSVEVPALKQQLKCGTISTSKARKICSVLSVENQEDWLELARTLTLKKLEQEVAQVNPREAVNERLNYVTGERLRLVIGVSEEFATKLKRAQDLVSNSHQSAASFEQTLDAALELFLEKRDPVRRAQRNAAKNAVSNAGAEPTEVGAGTHAALPHAARRIKTELFTRRKPVAAQTIHEINLRDQGRCTHLDTHGNRCEQTRWLDRHHRRAVSQGGNNSTENLMTLCSRHHALLHQAPLEPWGDVVK